MSNTVCNAVTPSVSNGVRRCVQNQNQNQTVVSAVGGWFVAKKSSNAAACIARGRAKTDGDFVAGFGGVQ